MKPVNSASAPKNEFRDREVKKMDLELMNLLEIQLGKLKQNTFYKRKLEHAGIDL